MAILRQGKPIGVCVHHSVYKPAKNLTELKAQATLFNGWHESKDWAEKTKTPSPYPYISYQWLMATNGDILNTTDEKYVKYAAGDNFRGDMSFNLHGTHICLTGNYQNDKPTPEMEKALVLFIRDYQKRYGIDAYVRGHKETSQDPTACPGTNIGTSKSGWLKGIIEKVNNPAYPPTEPPQAPEPTECEKRLKILQDTNTHLTEALGASEKGEQMALERADFLEGTLAVREKELKDLEADYKRVYDEMDRFEQEKLALQLKIDELNKPHWTEELRDRLYELWDEFKEKIISFVKRK